MDWRAHLELSKNQNANNDEEVLAVFVFTERHHAFISATFFRLLRDRDFPNYQEAFKMATQRYAEQRGSRMAQRAIVDGQVLDFRTYMNYGEWEFTDQYLATIEGKVQIEMVDDENNLTYKVHFCPWADEYRDLGLNEVGGVAYCSELDPSIARGFNPHLEYVTSEMLQNSNKCIQSLKGAKALGDLSFGERSEERLKDFEYHCGHIYKTFRDYMVAIYKSRGVDLSAQVLRAFSDKYGVEMADQITKYFNYDFNVID